MQLLHAVTCKSVTLFCTRKCAKNKKKKKFVIRYCSILFFWFLF